MRSDCSSAVATASPVDVIDSKPASASKTTSELSDTQ